jgi:signal transduction histidine kinase
MLDREFATMNRRILVWGVLAALIGCMLLVMLWITMIAMRTDRDARLMEKNTEQDRIISIALWRADSFLAPIVTKFASLPLDSFIGDRNFMFRQAVPVANEAFVRSRFHFPEAAESPDENPTKSTLTIQNDPNFIRTDLEQSVNSKTEWSKLFGQLPTETLPTREQLMALNLPGVSVNNGLTLNGAFVGNNASTPNIANDLQSRNLTLQNAQVQISQGQAFLQQTVPQATFSGSIELPGNQRLTEVSKIGISKPIWHQERLLIARTVRKEGSVAIQGTELDWPTLRSELNTQIQNLLPEAEFEPTFDVENDNHLLAALPVRIVVPSLQDDGFRWSPLMIAVAGGWAAMLFLSGGLLAISINSLRFADKRSSFVNSVTHELRTPLTTFKMYSELLSRGMVDEESRQTYLQTLCSESNRLCHLIDNVLTYARLEKGSESRTKETLTVERIMSRIVPRLAERAALDSMSLELRLDERTAKDSIHVDMPSLEQILYNLIDNASKYASQSADKAIQLIVSKMGNEIAFRVVDAGPGISRKQKAILFRPFSKSAEEAADSKPGVGLGLSLSARLAKQSAGQLQHVPTTTGCTMELRLPV